MMECLAEQSNLYAVQTNPSKLLMLTCKELVFFAVLLKMSMCSVPRLWLYWSKNLGIQYVSTLLTRVSWSRRFIPKLFVWHSSGDIVRMKWRYYRTGLYTEKKRSHWLKQWPIRKGLGDKRGELSLVEDVIWTSSKRWTGQPMESSRGLGNLQRVNEFFLFAEKRIKRFDLWDESPTSRHLQVLYHQTSFQVYSPTVQWSTPQVLEQVDQITWKDPNFPL